LPPADEAGHSDPYVQVYDYNNPEIKTEICEDTNNPIFYEVKEFTFSCNNVKGEIDLVTAPPMILNIFDHDDGYVDKTDDLIGRAVINLLEAANTDDGVRHISFDDEIPMPTWYPVKRHFDDEYDLETGASILVSIQIIQLDEEFSLPAESI
jgi:Ca2+-dependent lipid-binding protein